MRWHKGERYYLAFDQVDLFGDHTVVRAWGRIGTARGGVRVEPVADSTAAARRLAKIGRARQRRGYVEVGVAP